MPVKKNTPLHSKAKAQNCKCKCNNCQHRKRPSFLKRIKKAVIEAKNTYIA